MKLSVFISLRYIWMNTQGILVYLQNYTQYNCLNVVVRTILRRNKPRLFHALVEIRRARRTPTPGMSLFDSPVTREVPIHRARHYVCMYFLVFRR